MKTEEMLATAQGIETQPRRCVICDEPTDRLVDGEPSCDAHANLVYENQMEDYLAAHLT